MLSQLVLAAIPKVRKPWTREGGDPPTVAQLRKGARHCAALPDGTGRRARDRLRGEDLEMTLKNEQDSDIGSVWPVNGAHNGHGSAGPSGDPGRAQRMEVQGGKLGTFCGGFMPPWGAACSSAGGGV